MGSTLGLHAAVYGEITFVSQAEVGRGCVLSKHTIYLLDGRTLNVPVMVIGAARFNWTQAKLISYGSYSLSGAEKYSFPDGIMYPDALLLRVADQRWFSKEKGPE